MALSNLMKNNLLIPLVFTILSISMVVLVSYEQGGEHKEASKSILFAVIYALLVVSIPSRKAKMIACVLYCLSTISEIIFFYRMKVPVGVEHIHGILSDPYSAISMIDFGASEIKLFVFALSLFAAIKIILVNKIASNHSSLALSSSMASLCVLLVYLGAAADAISNPLFKHVTYAATHYGVQPTLSIEKRIVNSDPLPTLSKPNIILVVGESISRDMISQNASVMPFITDILSRGVAYNFDNCISNGTFTGLAVINMYFGLQGATVYTKPSPSLFSYAKKAGYSTIYTNSRNSRWHRTDQTIAQDVDMYIDINHEILSPECQIQHCGLLGSINDKKFYDAIKPLEILGGQPFFYTWHTDAAHPPYDRFENNGLSGLPAAMNRLDNVIESVVSNAPENTVIIFTSDHGHLHNIDTVEVPLFIINPHLLHGYKGGSRHNANPVSHHDLFNTLVETWGYSEFFGDEYGLFIDHGIQRAREVEVAIGATVIR